MTIPANTFFGLTYPGLQSGITAIIPAQAGLRYSCNGLDISLRPDSTLVGGGVITIELLQNNNVGLSKTVYVPATQGTELAGPTPIFTSENLPQNISYVSTAGASLQVSISTPFTTGGIDINVYGEYFV